MKSPNLKFTENRNLFVHNNSDMFTVSVVLRVPIFCRYYADIGN